ncbi:Rix1 complex component [Phycomyces blakesleeanus]
MPSERKIKKLKNEDFKKKKLKVGKKKTVADNFTDTSFKSKTISLPNQSINEDKSRETTTTRNLTLADLLVKLKHYNSGVRKEALLNMRDLCSDNPQILVSSLSTVVNSVLRLFMDDERDVRKALLSFLRDCFEPIDKIELQPFLPLLVIYTCSAMTHIFEDIRLDAIRLIDLWVDIAPEVLVSKFWDTVANNYLSLLSVDSNSIAQSRSNLSGSSAGHVSVASVKAAETKSHLHLHKSKLELLKSVSNFLEAGLSEDRNDNYWFFMNFLESRHARESFRNRLEETQASKDAKTLRWDQSGFTPLSAMIGSSVPFLSVNTLPGYSSLNLFESAGPKSTQAATGSVGKGASTRNGVSVHRSECSLDERVSDVKQLIETFQPILVGSWLETAPSVFTSNNISLTPALQLLETILRLSLVLWRSMVSKGGIGKLSSAWLDSHLQQFLKHISVYFPYGADAFGNRGGKVDSVLQEMNIMVCELTSLFLLARTMQTNSAAKEHLAVDFKIRKRSHSQVKDDENVPEWADRIVDHVLGVLGYEEEEVENEDGVPNMTSMSTAFKPEHLTSLLPTVWGFLNSLEKDRRDTVLAAFMGFHGQSHPQSATRKITQNFITRVELIQVTPSYNGRYHTRK